MRASWAALLFVAPMKKPKLTWLWAVGVGSLFLDCLGRDGLGQGVGHVEEGRDAAGGRGAAFALHVGFVRQARVAEVYVGVDDAGQQVAASGVDRFVAGHAGGSGAFDNFGDGVVLDDERADERAALVDEGGVIDVYPGVHGGYG